MEERIAELYASIEVLRQAIKQSDDPKEIALMEREIGEMYCEIKEIEEEE